MLNYQRVVLFMFFPNPYWDNFETIKKVQAPLPAWFALFFLEQSRISWLNFFSSPEISSDSARLLQSALSHNTAVTEDLRRGHHFSLGRGMDAMDAMDAMVSYQSIESFWIHMGVSENRLNP